VPIPVYDIAIIGGGVHGCGIARDAAGRGLTVHLCEQGDLAGAASSATTKLLHGGTRHLEHSGLRSVREALGEQEILLATAPHIVRPIRVTQPHGAGSRPRFLSHAGAIAHDRLAARKFLEPTRRIDLGSDHLGAPLRGGYQQALEFSDCRVDDSRLVVLNAIDARARGAIIQPRTRCIAARRANSYWRILLESSETGERRQIAARTLVNASGAWSAQVLEKIDEGKFRNSVRLVKRTHIVTTRLYDHEGAYRFRNSDGHTVFAVPFERDFTLIGSSDIDYRGDPERARPDEDEIDYLCGAASRYFRKPVTREAIRFVFCGVHALADDGASKAQQVRRNFVLNLDGSDGSTPLLTVTSGKMATYRLLSEEALARLSPYLRMGEPWTARTPLPGGGFAVGQAGDIVRALCAAYPFLPEPLANRLVNAYGTRAATIVTGARKMGDLGRNFGFDLSEAEVKYLMSEEWAISARDVLWRRSQLGLYFNEAQTEALDEWMAQARPRMEAPLTAGRPME
jgi:glycerol-3-phosphate dehydrogenase